jgi:SAM-dependent methyltransferase
MSSPKPRGLDEKYARQFCDESVVQAYEHRPPYPNEVFDVLAGLIHDRPRRLLDIGCGRGEIARRMLPHVDAVDAVDISAAMIQRGKTLDGGDDPKLRWICAKAEEADLSPPYALIVAASSIHWMDWHALLPRLAKILTPRGYLAMFDDGTRREPWSLAELIPRFSTNQEFEPYNTVGEFQRRRLFEVAGTHTTTAMPFRQTIEQYIESIHARNGFSRQRMTKASAKAFDDAVRKIVTPHARDGSVEIETISTIVWGKPL